MILIDKIKDKDIHLGYDKINNAYCIYKKDLELKTTYIVERKKIIGLYIYELRKLNKLPQKVVSDRAGITQAQYSKYENGKDQPKAELIIRLAKIFNVTTDYITGNKLQNITFAEEKEIYIKIFKMWRAYNEEEFPYTDEDIQEDAELFENYLLLINKSINSEIKRICEPIKWQI